MTATEFCPRCGTQRPPGAAFCPSCGQAFEQVPANASAGGSVQGNVADGMLQLEQLRLQLIPFRLLGLVAGGLLWWFVLGNILGLSIVAKR